MEEALAALVASTAWAAEAGAAQGILKTDPQGLPWYTWLWVLGVALIGWFASSAPTLAGWIDDGHTETPRELWTRRWGIVGRLAACLAAGLAAFFGGLLVGTPMVANFLAVLFAAYGGDKYLQMQADRVGARAAAAPPQPPEGG